ncbi:hypothetical protein [Aestuariimicrobium ganziense]|uniref:hypothetical protein n=1 Tax=Aestuariimicrobium ganziense TaxID=2773677 RepID=UPI0019408B24|nr:hypothetical protein [Aestuariimicrobium ganziense]
MSQNTPRPADSSYGASGIADPALVVGHTRQKHRWYSTWYAAFGFANLVMVGLVALLGSPWGWILAIILGVVAMIPLVKFVMTWPQIATEHRGTTAMFWIGLVVIWGVACWLANRDDGQRWIYWAAGLVMLVLGLVAAALIRKRSDDAPAPQTPSGAVF